MLRSIVAILAVASSALAQTTGYHALVKPVYDEVIPAGKTYTLEWKLSTLNDYFGPINLVLVGGPNAQGLQPLDTIGANIDPNLLKFDWPVAASLGKDKAYGVKVVLASDPSIYQWSNPFTISPVSGGSGSSDNSSTTASSTSSASSSSSTTSSSFSNLSTSSSTVGNHTISSGPVRTPTPTGNTSPTGAGQPTTTTSGRASISTGAAATAFAGSFAVLGGVAMAVLGM